MKYEKALYNANDVAKTAIKYSNIKGYPISNLKLQKVLYFIQAIFLNEYNRACFSDDIEAWAFGPVVPSVYQKYKIFGANSIPESACKSNSLIKLFSSDKSEKNTDVSEDDNSLIHGIVDFLSDYSATQLVEITHRQSPWNDAYAPMENNIITNESLIEYFGKNKRDDINGN